MWLPEAQGLAHPAHLAVFPLGDGDLHHRPVRVFFQYQNGGRGGELLFPYVTTTSDELGRRCVTQLVEDLETRVYPVGRLDRDSEGLLLLAAVTEELLDPDGFWHGFDGPF